MLRAMDAAVAGLRAHQNKMDVVGHNIANVNTFGFKAQTYTFKEAMYQTSTSSTGGTDTAAGTNSAQFGYGALMGTIGMDMTASTPTYVGGFNATISGDGFFMVKKTKMESGVAEEDIKGNDFYFTRVGQFSLDSNGYVVDGDKNFVYGFAPKDDDNGDIDNTQLVPLRMPTGYTAAVPGAGGAAGTPAKVDFDNLNADTDALLSKEITINSAGEIMVKIEYPYQDANGVDKVGTATVSLGKVAIATFQNPNGLSKAGGNYYTTVDGDNAGTAAAGIAGGANPDLMTGYVEASNVDLAKEFADMITTHRGFQSNTKMITVSDEMLSDLVAMKR